MKRKATSLHCADYGSEYRSSAAFGYSSILWCWTHYSLAFKRRMSVQLTCPLFPSFSLRSHSFSLSLLSSLFYFHVSIDGKNQQTKRIIDTKIRNENMQFVKQRVPFSTMFFLCKKKHILLLLLYSLACYWHFPELFVYCLLLYFFPCEKNIAVDRATYW